jgi:two-component system nitrate/nitrite response regulator NarP
MKTVLAKKILVIEDHPLMGNAICSGIAMLGHNLAFDQATSLGHALSLLDQTRDAHTQYLLIVTDLRLPDSKGLATLSALKSSSPLTPIVVLTMDDDPHIAVACEALQVSYISKSDASNEFEKTIQSVLLKAGAAVPVPLNQHVTAPSAGPKLQPLTDRQTLVLAELAQGYSNKEISRRMNVSEETVRGHLAEIFKRLGVQNRTQATKYYLLSAHVQGQA